MKISMNIMPLEVTPPSYFLTSTDNTSMAVMQISEVEATH